MYIVHVHNIIYVTTNTKFVPPFVNRIYHTPLNIMYVSMVAVFIFLLFLNQYEYIIHAVIM